MWVSRVEYPILVTNEFLEIFTGQKVHFLKFQLQQKRQKSDTYALSYQNCRQPCSLFFNWVLPYMEIFSNQQSAQNQDLKADLAHIRLFLRHW